MRTWGCVRSTARRPMQVTLMCLHTNGQTHTKLDDRPACAISDRCPCPAEKGSWYFSDAARDPSPRRRDFFAKTCCPSSTCFFWYDLHVCMFHCLHSCMFHGSRLQVPHKQAKRAASRRVQTRSFSKFFGSAHPLPRRHGSCLPSTLHGGPQHVSVRSCVFAADTL